MNRWMTGAVLLAAGLQLAAPALAATIEPLPRDSVAPADCRVIVRFGSICCGADWRLEERIKAAVAGERRVSRAFGWSWGEEGESSLCLVTDRGSARSLAARFRRWNAAGPNPALTSVEIVGR